MKDTEKNLADVVTEPECTIHGCWFLTIIHPPLKACYASRLAIFSFQPPIISLFNAFHFQNKKKISQVDCLLILLLLLRLLFLVILMPSDRENTHFSVNNIYELISRLFCCFHLNDHEMHR